MAYSRSDYEKMTAMQNAYNQQSALGNFMKAAQRNPLDGYDIRNCPMDELELMIEVLAKEYDRRTMDTPLPSPTRRQLQNNEALKNAYEAMQIVLKLQGK